MTLNAFSNLNGYDSMIISLRYSCLCLGGCEGKVPSKEKRNVKANIGPFAITGYWQHWTITLSHLQDKSLEQRRNTTAFSLLDTGTAEQGQQVGQGMQVGEVGDRNTSKKWRKLHISFTEEYKCSK